MSLYDALGIFESAGIFDIGLPFILIFTISFAIMQKINLFGAGKKNINLIVALVLAFLSIRNVFLIEMLNRFLPNIAMFLIIILMFLLLLGTFGGKTPEFGNFLGIIAFIVALVAVILSLSSDFVTGLGYGFILPPFLADIFYDYQTRAMILFVGGLVAVIYFATLSPDSSPDIWSKVKEMGNELMGKGRP